MKKISYLDKVQNKNVFEEYCAVLPKFLGRKVRHYDMNSSGKAFAVEFVKDSTVKKIIILLSHLTFIVPAFMYSGKAIERLVHPVEIAITAPEGLSDKEQEDYIEIRNLRDDSSYIPEGCKGPRFPLRLQLPIDRLLSSNKKDDVSPEEEDPEFSEGNSDGEDCEFPNQYKDFFGRHKEEMHFLEQFNIQPLDRKIEEERKVILQNNGFLCVHGVEAAKGGKRNILNMMLEGVVRAPYTGGLIDGMADCCAGPHGPYYVILDPSHCNKSRKRNGLWEEKAQVAFLVPDESDRKYLNEGLSKAVEKQFITEEEKLRMLRKVITYKEFLALPKKERHSEKKLAKWLKQRSVI